MRNNLILILIVSMLTSACGYSSRSNEVIGQAKKIINQTPLLCADRTDGDLSLGVMRNGVGSMSTQDVWFTIPKAEDQALFKQASENGAIVKVTYDVARVVFCWSNHIVTKVELVK